MAAPRAQDGAGRRREGGASRGRERHQVAFGDVAFGGDAVGRLPDGRVVFAPLVAPGEEAVVEMIEARKNFVRARAVEITRPSPERIPAPCPYYGDCGGCSYQHLAYPAQLALKQSQLAATLRRVGRLEAADAPVRPIVASPLEYGYRNRITVHLRDGEVGFNAAGGRRLVPIKHCLLAQPEVNALLASLAADPRRRREDGHRTLRADRTRRFFTQANDTAAALLLALVEQLASPGGTSLVDAYCGAGWLLKALRPRFQQCIGLEWDLYAIEAARADAAPNESYLEGDAAALLPEALAQADATDTTLLLDPPAEGVATAALDAVIAHPPRRIIYVSCHPATLARDLARLRAGPFRVVSVTPVDLFPQTAEIEAVALLVRGAAQTGGKATD